MLSKVWVNQVLLHSEGRTILLKEKFSNICQNKYCINPEIPFLKIHTIQKSNIQRCTARCLQHWEFLCMHFTISLLVVGTSDIRVPFSVIIYFYYIGALGNIIKLIKVIKWGKKLAYLKILLLIKWGLVQKLFDINLSCKEIFVLFSYRLDDMVVGYLFWDSRDITLVNV